MEANPSVQTRLRAALRAALPGPAPPSAAQILAADVPYLSAACEEAARLGGAAKAQLRRAVVDAEVLGCPVPRGAQLFLNLHIDRAPPAAPPVDEARRSPSSRAAAARLGDGIRRARDLECFVPERWLARDDARGTESFNAQALPSTAFGGGFRGCFGMLPMILCLPILTVDMRLVGHHLRPALHSIPL